MLAGRKIMFETLWIPSNWLGLCILVESQAKTNASKRCTSRADKLHTEFPCEK